MTLSKAEWRKRVNAAAALHGLELKDLRDPVQELAGKGVPINAAARAGHDSDDYGPNHALALVLSELLEVPVGWFEDEDWRPIIATDATTDDLVTELRETVDGLREEMLLLRADVAELGVDFARGKDQVQKWQRRARGLDK